MDGRAARLIPASIAALTYRIRASTVAAERSALPGGSKLASPKARTATPRARRVWPTRGQARATIAVAALALFFAALSGPPARGQSSGTIGPDASPVEPAPEPDAAPAAGSDNVESSPPPASPPATAAPAPASSAPTASASPSSHPINASPSASPPARKSTREHKQAARKSRTSHQAKQRAQITRPDPDSVFGDGLPLSRLTGRDVDSESPPAQLIALALLALVVAGASFLTLTARLSREWRG